MFQLDKRTMAIHKLIEELTSLLIYEGLMDNRTELKPFLAEADLGPDSNTAHHAASAAVHVLLAAQAAAPTMKELDELDPDIPARSNGHSKKAVGAASHQRRRQSPSSTTISKKTKQKVSPVRCEICGKLISRPGNLPRHIKTAHPDAVTAGGAA